VTLEIVAGLSLKCMKPRVWDPKSEYYLPNLRAVMFSYADFHRQPAQRRKAMERGLHEHFGIPSRIKIYLDNGAFYFLSHDGGTPRREYEEFVTRAQPDWWPIPQDFIPTPQMTKTEQRRCFTRTMQVNHAYQHDGFVPVIHTGQFLEQYTESVQKDERLATKPKLALGGIVPNLLRSPKAVPYVEILGGLIHVRQVFAGKSIHVFGIGGTATLHLAALLEMDSVDSSGWRNRAARGIVQLPGSGDRVVAELGNWEGRKPSNKEWEKLKSCHCPACREFGIAGLKADKIFGFCNRATHNLWVLLEENQRLQQRLGNGTYAKWYERHLDNSIYLPLIRQLLTRHNGGEAGGV
jgi:7-cyano-7-deazaguanine tRNA-ribosyltransferase